MLPNRQGILYTKSNKYFQFLLGCYRKAMKPPQGGQSRPLSIPFGMLPQHTQHEKRHAHQAFNSFWDATGLVMRLSGEL